VTAARRERRTVALLTDGLSAPSVVVVADARYTLVDAPHWDMYTRRTTTRGNGRQLADRGRPAYHSVTTAVAEISPSLGPAVPLGRATWTVAPPGEGDTTQDLAERVRTSIADMNRHGVRLAAFIADSLFSSDGIQPDPAGL
jgi:hypothetical protein